MKKRLLLFLVLCVLTFMALRKWVRETNAQLVILIPDQGIEEYGLELAVMSIVPNEILFIRDGGPSFVYDLDPDFLKSHRFMRGPEYLALVGQRKILFFDDTFTAKHFLNTPKLLDQHYPGELNAEGIQIRNAAWNDHKLVLTLQLKDIQNLGPSVRSGLEVTLTPGEDNFTFIPSRPVNKSLSLIMDFSDEEMTQYTVSDMRILGSNRVATLRYQDYLEKLMPHFPTDQALEIELYDEIMIARNQYKTGLFGNSLDSDENQLNHFSVLHSEKGGAVVSYFCKDRQEMFMLFRHKPQQYSFVAVSLVNGHVERSRYRFQVPGGFISSIHRTDQQNRVIMPLQNYRLPNSSRNDVIHFVTFDFQSKSFQIISDKPGPEHIISFHILN
jgi:hypothetical protein